MTHGEAWYEQKQIIDLSQEFYDGPRRLPRRMSRKDGVRYYTAKLRNYWTGKTDIDIIDETEVVEVKSDIPVVQVINIPKHKQLEPLEYTWLKTLYWDLEWTDDKIAQHLGVSAGWVFSEIKRLDLVKSEHGIKYKGKKGFVQSPQQRKKRQNQPHAVQVNKLDKDGNYIETYRSMKCAAISNDIASPSHIRRAIKEPYRTCRGFKWEYAS